MRRLIRCVIALIGAALLGVEITHAIIGVAMPIAGWLSGGSPLAVGLVMLGLAAVPAVR